MNNESKFAKLELASTMLLFGSIGTLSRFIDAPSGVICLARAFFGVISIALCLLIMKRRLDIQAIKHNKFWIMLGSVIMCVNWICQFEAYKNTTIATGTLCYYTEPIFFILAGFILLKEKPSPKKVACIIVAFIGMIFVSGVITVGFNIAELKGALYGIAGGFFYAMVVIINKNMKGISPTDITFVQLMGVVPIMAIYSKITGGYAMTHLDTRGLICLLVLGAGYTGIGYIIYYDAVKKLSTQTAGIISYIDPLEAVLLSAFFLREPITTYTIIGSILILGATAVSELSFSRKSKQIST